MLNLDEKGKTNFLRFIFYLQSGLPYFQEKFIVFDRKDDFRDEYKEEQRSNKVQELMEDAWKRARSCRKAAQLCCKGKGPRTA